MTDAIPFSTDAAALAVFDAAVLRHRVRSPGEWWRVPRGTAVPEVAAGQAAIYPLGAEGNYRVALRAGGALAEAERALAVGKVEGLGLQVTSGEVFVGAAERLPGDGRGDRMPAIPGTGALLAVPEGAYRVTVHVLAWRHRRELFDDEDEPLPDAPSDFVVVLEPGRASAVPQDVPPLLDLLPKHEAKATSRVRRGGGPGVVPARPAPASRPPAPRPAASSAPASPPRPGSAAPPAARPGPGGSAAVVTIRAALREVLDESARPRGPIPFATLRLRPRDRTLLAQDVAVDDLLAKVTRVREQVRVLEARVNADEHVEAATQLELQAPITAVYEALDDLLDWLALLGGGEPV